MGSLGICKMQSPGPEVQALRTYISKRVFELPLPLALLAL